MEVKHGKTYLLRIVNAVMDESLFLAVAQHKLVVVGTDASRSYYLAAAAYSSAFGAGFDNTTTTAILHYQSSPPQKHSNDPLLPPHDATLASTEFTRRLRSPPAAAKNLPTEVDTRVLITASVNLLNCSGCAGPFGKRFAASLNNISFVPPSTDVLQAYYRRIGGVFEADFPEKPAREFDYTGENLPGEVLAAEMGTRALVVEYNASVEMVLQGTNVVASDNHPMHMHGYGFYVVGWGFGNFDPEKGPLGYNLDDPPQETTVGIPKDGWVALRGVVAALSFGEASDVGDEYSYSGQKWGSFSHQIASSTS
uniref:Laccase 28 n=1 Tax=Salvia miltiorrhiza TaxID=226208 RepID=A0A4Y5RSQ5_SALMI|nr:laccase 28 [Salvia miltiorrhiza]